MGRAPLAAWPLAAPLRLAAFPRLPLDRLRRAAALRWPGSHLLQQQQRGGLSGRAACLTGCGGRAAGERQSERRRRQQRPNSLRCTSAGDMVIRAPSRSAPISRYTVTGLRSEPREPPLRRCCSSLPRSAVINSEAIWDAGGYTASSTGEPSAARGFERCPPPRCRATGACRECNTACLTVGRQLGF